MSLNVNLYNEAKGQSLKFLQDYFCFGDNFLDVSAWLYTFKGPFNFPLKTNHVFDNLSVCHYEFECKSLHFVFIYFEAMFKNVSQTF